MSHPPISEGDRLRIAELADEGLSVREIARELGLSPSTVTRNARRMGLRFDRAATEAATRARRIDAKARRAAAAVVAMDEALAELAKLHQPCRVVGVVGGNNAGVHEKVIPRPHGAERVAIAKVFDTLVNAHLKLTAIDMGQDDSAHARSVLGLLQVQLQAVAGELTAGGDAGTVPVAIEAGEGRVTEIRRPGQ